MDIKLIARPNPLYAEFFINDVDVHVLNSLRRAILTEVPVLAIHDVIVHINTSVLYDEELAHRLALIPLRIDKKELDILKECVDIENASLEDLTKCTARLRLHKKDEEEKIITVYSGDLEPIDKKTVRPVYDNIPIVKLGPGQEIELEAIAKVGKGKDHAKWMPVSTLGYKPLPILIATEACDGCGKCVEACPKGVLKMNGKPYLEGIGLYLCDLDRICVRACPKKALSLEPSDSQFIFRLESVGQYSPEEIIISAIDILEKKFLKFLNLLKEEVAKFKRE